MRKMFGVFVLGIFLFSMMGIVSAGPVEGIQDFAEGVYVLISPVLEKVVGPTEDTDIFLMKILFLIIILALVWKALENIPFFEETAWVLWIVSISVSILATRWITGTEVINTILLPYSALGIALTAGLPFLAYFFLVKDFSTTLRKVSWVFFIVVFVGLWIMRSGDGSLVGGAVGNFAYIYLATAGLSLLVLMFDGTIQRIMSKSKIDKIHSLHKGKLAGDLRDELRKLTDRWKEEGESYEGVYSRKKGDNGYKADRDRINDMLAEMKK